MYQLTSGVFNDDEDHWRILASPENELFQQVQHTAARIISATVSGQLLDQTYHYRSEVCSCETYIVGFK